MMTKVHMVTVLVIDHDDLGPDGVRETLEHTKYPNWCMCPSVMDIQTREVEWSDDHPLNGGKQEQAAKELFGMGDTTAAQLLTAALAELEQLRKRVMPMEPRHFGRSRWDVPETQERPES